MTAFLPCEKEKGLFYFLTIFLHQRLQNSKQKPYMTQTLLFLSFSALALTALVVADYFKKASFRSLLGLFLFGILISIPFI
ncbi:MAG: hypothetical protein V1880_04660, partial [Patescibacteria group bacterium]